MNSPIPSDLTGSELTGTYVDLQVNGYVGVDFNDPRTTIADVCRAAEAMDRDGVASAFPTIITGSMEVMTKCITTVRMAIEQESTAQRVLAGIHIEGPFLSAEPGYIGAHPAEHALAQNMQALETLLDAGNLLVRLFTLAPEIDVNGLLTAHCRARGIAVAAGHTDASLEQLEICIENGLQLFTHLGNGCPRLLDRHDNIIYRALRFRERLNYSLIADSFHLPKTLFENLLNWIPGERILVVSDAISAAGLGPGTYRLAGRQVQVGADKAVRDPSGEHFVGAASTMHDADSWLRDVLKLDLSRRRQMLVENPKRLITLGSEPSTKPAS